MWSYIVLAVLLAFVGWLVYVAYFQDESAGPERAATISEITTEPEEFIGETVTVSGEVAGFASEDAFVIGSEDADSSLLVQAQTNLPNRVSEDDVVRVTGTVRELMIAEFEDEFGAFDEGFDEEAFGGEPVVVANRVILISNETAD